MLRLPLCNQLFGCSSQLNQQWCHLQSVRSPSERFIITSLYVPVAKIVTFGRLAFTLAADSRVFKCGKIGTAAACARGLSAARKEKVLNIVLKACGS